ncbi:MAG: spore coat protein [Clostridia bacterium]|nr:spore coat protein [Clostridia bacterium]
MASILGNMFGATTDKSADETLAFNSMVGAAGLATAYLAATLEATTPEVRRLFGEYVTQSVIGHEAVTELCIKRGWVKPYEAPVKQLQTSYQSSQTVLGTGAQQ